MTRWLTTLALLAFAASAWAAAPPDAQTRARFAQIEEATRLNLRGEALYQAGRWPEATKVLAEVLRMRERLYPKERYPQGHPDLALSLNNLAFLHKEQGEHAKAEPLFARALRMREGLYPKALYPQGHPDVALSLNNLAMLYYTQRDYAKAARLYARALEMREALFPKALYPHGHHDLAQSLNNLAALHYSEGEYAKAEPLYARALRMREGLYPKAQYPQGHPLLAFSINDLAFLHQARGDYARAEPLFRRALKMKEGLYPQGHPSLAVSINNLAVLHHVQGEHAKAEPLFRRALQMYEGLYPPERYPQGHPDLALGINNLAVLHKEQGEYAKAESLYRRALRMFERLYSTGMYPQGHIALATSLNNLALLHSSQGAYAEALPLYRRALAMREGLFPKERFPQGHPDLASSLNNLAALHQAQGEHARAEPLFRRAVRMKEGLYPPARYPQGHPDLALSIHNLALLHDSRGEYAKAESHYARALRMREGLYPPARYPQGHPELASSIHHRAALHQAQGENAKAEPLFRRALQMYAASAAALAASASEATALNYLASLPLTRDGYLSVTRPPHEADTYPAVWQSKAALSRLYERRHLAVLAASSNEARSLWEGVLARRRERERLLLASADPAKAQARDRRLGEIDEEIRQKEEALLPLLPALKRSDELGRATPAELCKALPAGTALVDLLRYVHIEQDPRVPGKKGEKRTPRYVAFVVTRQGIARIELGAAKAVEEMLALWRRAVQEDSPAEPGYAEKAHALLWAPLRKHLPAKASVVYVSPDAALNRLPWAALRDGKSGRVLIEEHAVAVVPHGVMLLDKLTEEKAIKEDRPTLLAMGGVAYDHKPSAATELALRGPVGETVKWAALPGTQKELEQIVSLAGRRRVVRLEGEAAGAEALLAALPTAQTAHLATHGFFADARFRSALQLDEKLFRSTQLPTGSPRRFDAGSRSPMVLSGLVCSGANVPGAANRGVLTAEAIAGLDLRRLRLAVLSACETGLGEQAGGEAVYGLVRAFHVAGTRDVAASLWKVDDEATAALMVLFYRHLWGKQPVGPAEALRRAQLAIYRQPGRIKEWAQGRGPLPVPVVASVSVKEKQPGGTTSPARTWAAFVLSGPGD
jgi:CHAT domain-containing protein